MCRPSVSCRIRDAELLRIKIKKSKNNSNSPNLPCSPKTRHIWQLSRHASGIGNSLSSNPHRTCGGCRGNVTSCCMQLSCLATNLLWRRKLCNILQLLPSGRGHILSRLNLQKSIFVESHTQFKLVKQKSTPCLLCDTCGQAREKGDPCVLLAGTISLTAPTEPFNYTIKEARIDRHKHNKSKKSQIRTSHFWITMPSLHDFTVPPISFENQTTHHENRKAPALRLVCLEIGTVCLDHCKK